MKFIGLPIQFKGKLYKIDPYFGLLLEFEKYYQNVGINQPEKLIAALKHCNNPYSLKQYELHTINRKLVLYKILLTFYFEWLIKLNNLNFGIGRWFSFFGRPIFEDARQAINFFRNHKPGKIQNDLCLSRSLFAASTSKKFKEKGVVFIGVSLPSKSMHAWVIEDGTQPDPCDYMWINFQPVAAIC